MPLQAWTVNGSLYVSGLIHGSQWSVYNALGTLVCQGAASSDKAEVALPGRGVYIITSGNSVVN